jgi:hypothetical protein
LGWDGILAAVAAGLTAWALALLLSRNPRSTTYSAWPAMPPGTCSAGLRRG